ncbi:hypothetical protein [Allokutzneria oryzae]|uniref:Serine hydrolase n=1 Tax=Allokutzneria oryzae TaxID=1378989 RepID=A0ABV5ZZU6_9PSEU
MAPAAVAESVDITAAVAVYDRQRARFSVERDVDKPYRSASVVKLLIALDHLYEHDPVLVLENAKTDAERNDILYLRAMLRGSWDYAASVFWVRGGYTDIVARMVKRVGLKGTRPPEKPGMWGYTALTPADVVRVYNHILDEAPAKYRDFIMTNTHMWERCGEDAWDQSFGIPRAFGQPWSAKQGWSGWGATPPAGQDCSLGSPRVAGPVAAAKEDEVDFASPLLHTTGTVGKDDRSVVVVFSTFPKGTTWRQGADRITKYTRALLPYVPGARPGRG